MLFFKKKETINRRKLQNTLLQWIHRRDRLKRIRRACILSGEITKTINILNGKISVYDRCINDIEKII